MPTSWPRAAVRAFGSEAVRAGDLERHVASLHLEDLALACACAVGDEGAWEHLVREHRPQLYRAANALDPTGGARDLADSLYADLYGFPIGRGSGNLSSAIFMAEAVSRPGCARCWPNGTSTVSGPRGGWNRCQMKSRLPLNVRGVGPAPILIVLAT